MRELKDSLGLLKVKEFISLLGRAPSVSTEPKLHTLYASFISPSSPCCRPKFRAEMLRKGYLKRGTPTNPKQYKKDILNFIRKHGRAPNVHEDPEHHRMRKYITPSSTSFDPDFRKKIMDLVGIKKHNTKEKKQAVLAFYKKTGMLPREHSKDPVSHLLGAATKHYVNPKNQMYDPVFAAWRAKVLQEIYD